MSEGRFVCICSHSPASALPPQTIRRSTVIEPPVPGAISLGTAEVIGQLVLGLKFLSIIYKKTHLRGAAVPVWFGLPSPAENRWEPRLGPGLGLRACFLRPGTVAVDTVWGSRCSSWKEVKL